MFQHSWFYRNSLFYTLLALVILLHLLLLAVKMSHDRSLVEIHEQPQAKLRRPFKITMRFKPVPKKQIVQSEDPETLEKPLNKSFLSDRNRRFDRQTMARKIDTFRASGKGRTSRPKISLSDLGAFKKGHDPLRAAAVQKSENQKSGVSATNDYVEGVPLGDLTYLNTVEYKYYGFYFRIRQKLEQFWGKTIQEKAQALIKQGRQVASNNNLITALVVTLNELGQIVGIAIKGASGVRELDEAAVESFNQAGPFPNPPRGLIENGRVKIEWGFVIKT